MGHGLGGVERRGGSPFPEPRSPMIEMGSGNSSGEMHYITKYGGRGQAGLGGYGDRGGVTGMGGLASMRGPAGVGGYGNMGGLEAYSVVNQLGVMEGLGGGLHGSGGTMEGLGDGVMFGRGSMHSFQDHPYGSPLMGHHGPPSHNGFESNEGLGMGRIVTPHISRHNQQGRGQSYPFIGMGLDPRSRAASIRSGGSVRGMEMARFDVDGGLGGHPSNYRSPYVEDYESQIDDYERRMQGMAHIDEIGLGDGLMYPASLQDFKYLDFSRGLR